MDSDDRSSWPPTSGGYGDAVRRRVVDAAADLLRGVPGLGSAEDGADGSAFSPDAPGHAGTTLYLALLQDRLPIYARAMKSLGALAGRASVEENLVPAAQATIDFYCAILTAKVSVFADPERLLNLRRVLKAHGLGPQAAYDAVVGYLTDERRRGRVLAEVDCGVAARLLLGACVNYAFTKVLMDDVPPRDRFIAEVVRGLRLTSSRPDAGSPDRPCDPTRDQPAGDPALGRPRARRSADAAGPAEPGG